MVVGGVVESVMVISGSRGAEVGSQAEQRQNERQQIAEQSQDVLSDLKHG